MRLHRTALLGLLAVLTAAPAFAQNSLPLSGEHELRRNQRYTATSGQYLVFQGDGNLVVYSAAGQPTWALQEVDVNYRQAGRVTLQADGNFAVYTASGQYLWSALTADPDPTAQLTITPSGGLQLASAGRGVLWSSDGSLPAPGAGQGVKTLVAEGLSGPIGLVASDVVAGAFLVAEYGRGQVTAVIPNNPSQSQSGFDRPVGLAETQMAGVLAITDRNAGQILFLGGNGPAPAAITGLTDPVGAVAVSGGAFIAAESRPGRVTRVAAGQAPMTLAQDLAGPYDVSVAADGRVLVTEFDAGRVTAIAGDCSTTTFADGLDTPAGIVALADGRALVVERGAGRVTVVGGGRPNEVVVDGLQAPTFVAVSRTGGPAFVSDFPAGKVFSFGQFMPVDSAVRYTMSNCEDLTGANDDAEPMSDDAETMIIDGTEVRTGPIQVTLEWDGTADLDLFVTDPAGDQVGYRTPRVASGGLLDVDARANCQDTGSTVENIVWERTPPSGAYQVTVDHYRACGQSGSVSYTATLRRDGQVMETWRGTVGGGEDTVYTYDAD